MLQPYVHGMTTCSCPRILCKQMLQKAVHSQLVSLDDRGLTVQHLVKYCGGMTSDRDSVYRSRTTLEWHLPFNMENAKCKSYLRRPLVLFIRKRCDTIRLSGLLPRLCFFFRPHFLSAIIIIVARQFRRWERDDSFSSRRHRTRCPVNCLVDDPDNARPSPHQRRSTSRRRPKRLV